jgi:HlyD family secretion protein
MFTKKSLFILAAIAAVAAAAAFVMRTGPETPVADAPEAASADVEASRAPVRPAITVAKAEKAVLRDRVRASGFVGAVEKVLVQPQIDGQAIDDLLAEVGDHVEAGQVLARLSDTTLKLDKSQLVASRANALAQIAQADALLVEAKASSEDAQRNLDRARQLRQQGNVSQAAADQAETAATAAAARVLVASQNAAAAQAQLELVDAQMANVDLQLSRTEIKAPFAGEVVEKNAVVGAIASASSQPMFVIVRDAQLELTADVAQQDLARVSVGMRVDLRAAGLREALTGTIRLVEPAIDLDTRQGRVRVSIDQSDQIRSGMFLEAEVGISEREVLAVPITALATDDQGAFVMRVEDDGLVRRIPVEAGVRDGAMIEVVSGLEPGVNVVAKAASFVRDGDMVAPVPLSAAVTN